jgi:hypothetical protein
MSYNNRNKIAAVRVIKAEALTKTAASATMVPA